MRQCSWNETFPCLFHTPASVPRICSASANRHHHAPSLHFLETLKSVSSRMALLQAVSPPLSTYQDKVGLTRQQGATDIPDARSKSQFFSSHSIHVFSKALSARGVRHYQHDMHVSFLQCCNGSPGCVTQLKRKHSSNTNLRTPTV